MILHSAAASTVPTPPPTIATGGTVTYDGDYAIHSFTSVGTGSFTIQSLGIDNTFDVLVVAGGGAAGLGGSITGIGTFYGSGGGGGGVVYQVGRSLAVGQYQVIVGDGGTWDGISEFQQYNSLSITGSGENSSFDSLTAIGGGGGASYNSDNRPFSIDPNIYAGSGGSAGGLAGGYRDGSTTSCASEAVMADLTGSALQPVESGDSGTYGFGNLAGYPSNCQSSVSPPSYDAYVNGGAGGGAGGAATTVTGGLGKTVDIRGTNETFAAGGNVGAFANGAANTGDGGSSGTDGGFNDGYGGSGIVVIRYKYK